MTLNLAQRTALAQYIIDHPGLTEREYAVATGTTVPQVRYARQQAERGKLPVRRTAPNEELQAHAEMIAADSDTLFEEQLHLALAKLSANRKLSPMKRLEMLERVARLEKARLAVSIGKHIRSADADVIRHIVHMFKPTATKDDIIRIYEEARERCLHDRRD